MGNLAKAAQQAPAGGGLLGAIWKHRWWWILPLGVLILLLCGIYALEHISKTDSEMYPTSTIHFPNFRRLC